MLRLKVSILCKRESLLEILKVVETAGCLVGEIFICDEIDYFSPTQSSCDLFICYLDSFCSEEAVDFSLKACRLSKCGMILYIVRKSDCRLLHKAALLNSDTYIVGAFRQKDIEIVIELIVHKKYREAIVEKKIFTIDSVYSYCFACQTLFQNGEKVSLVKKEVEFLELLIKSKNSLVTYEVLDERIWGNRKVANNTRRQFIYRFRNKAPFFPLKLIRGIGLTIER